MGKGQGMKNGVGVQHGRERDVSYNPTPLAAGHLQPVCAPRASDTGGKQPPAPVSPGHPHVPACRTHSSPSPPRGEPCGWWASSAAGQGCQPPAPLQSRALQPLQLQAPARPLAARTILEGPGKPEGSSCSDGFGPSSPIILTNPFLAQMCAGQGTRGRCARTTGVPSGRSLGGSRHEGRLRVPAAPGGAGGG